MAEIDLQKIQLDRIVDDLISDLADIDLQFLFQLSYELLMLEKESKIKFNLYDLLNG